MTKKIFILVIILLVVAGLYYFVFRTKKEVTGDIQVAYLEMFPAGTTIGPGMKGTQTGTFYKDDIMAIRGQTNLTGKAKLTFQIVDEQGRVVQTGVLGIIKEAGDFGMCCVDFPKTPGNYNLNLFLNGRPSLSIPFEVVE